MLRWPRSKKDVLTCDVVVVGSGGAGLTAAMRAHDRGLKVLILEKTDKIGGATAASGGMIWIPLNHHMAEIGASDSKEEVMTYIRRLASGRVPESIIEAYVDTTPKMLRYIEEKTPLCRVGQPEDVAGVVVFLASEQARWLTGQLLYVGGGWRMHQ